MSPATPRLTLYDHPVSSYAQKIRIALREKGLPFTSVIPPDLNGSSSGPLHSANPRVEVPVLIHHDAEISSTDSSSTGNDVTLFDSTIIMEYLEDRFPQTPLLPKNAAARAKHRMVEDVTDTQYEAVNWGITEIRFFGRAEGKLAEEMLQTAAEQTGTLQTWLSSHLGDSPYFAGDEFGWADCAVAPIVNRSVSYGLGPVKGSVLQKWHARIQERGSIRLTFGEYEAGFAKMPALKDAFVSGQRKRQYRDHRLEWMVKSGGLQVVKEGLERENIRFNWPDHG